MHVIASRGGGGAESFYVRLLQAMHQRGHRVHAVHPPDSYVDRELDPAVPRTHIPMRSLWDLSARWRLRRLIQRRAPAIVQTYLGRATRLIHLSRRPGIVHVARLGGYYKLKGFRHAHAWVGNTAGVRDYLLHGGLEPDRVTRIGNFVRPAGPTRPDQVRTLRQHLAIPENVFVILAVGRLHSIKGLDLLLDALNQEVQTGAEESPHLLLVGDGPERERLQQRVARLGLVSLVHWAGWQADPYPYYAACDLVVSASREETLGNTILEAWAHAKPVLSTATAGARELIEHRRNGWVVPLMEPAAMAKAMALLQGDEVLRRRLGEVGADRLHKDYSEAGVVQQYLDFYHRLSGH